MVKKVKYTTRGVQAHIVEMQNGIMPGQELLTAIKNISSTRIKLQNRSDLMVVLKEYTDFLLRDGYCDTDVYAEGETAIDAYMRTKGL